MVGHTSILLVDICDTIVYDVFFSESWPVRQYRWNDAICLVGVWLDFEPWPIICTCAIWPDTSLTRQSFTGSCLLRSARCYYNPIYLQPRYQDCSQWWKRDAGDVKSCATTSSFAQRMIASVSHVFVRLRRSWLRYDVEILRRATHQQLRLEPVWWV